MAAAAARWGWGRRAGRHSVLVRTPHQKSVDERRRPSGLRRFSFPSGYPRGGVPALLPGTTPGCKRRAARNGPRPVPFLRARPSPRHDDPAPRPRERALRHGEAVVASVPRRLRAAPARAVSLLPAPHAQPVGRRGPGAGHDGPRVRHARLHGRGAARTRGPGCSASPRTCGSITRAAPDARGAGATCPTRPPSRPSRAPRARPRGRSSSGSSPQERAAVVLKDVFDLSLEEIAEALSTTTGAVKAALHRGRGKLVEPEPPEPSRAPAPAVLDAFCAAFNARRPRSPDRAPARHRRGRGGRRPRPSTAPRPRAARRLHGHALREQAAGRAETRRRHRTALRAGRAARSCPASRCAPTAASRSSSTGTPHEDGEAVRAVTRVEPDGDRVARLRNYFFTPDFIAEVCGELGVPFRPNGYRYWPAPGRNS